MASPSAPKDKFFEKVINPYLAEVLRHPQPLRCVMGCCTSAMLRDKREPEAWSRGSKQWSNTSHKMLAEFTNNYEPDAKNTEEAIFKLKRRSSTSKPKFMICKIKTVSMNIDSKG